MNTLAFMRRMACLMVLAPSRSFFIKYIMEFMRTALDQARLALDEGEVPVGCCLVRDGQVIAKSHNLTVKSKNATTHCEINCIRELSLDNSKVLREATLYVTVEPCIMCAYALVLAGVTKVVYGCDNDKFGGNGSVLSIHLLDEQG